MSLINDALKKAQRQQTGGAPAPASGEVQPGGATPRIERREKPADFRSQMLILGGVSLGLLLALMVGGFFWWRGSHPSEPVATPPVAQTTAPAATTTKPEVPTPAKTEPAPEPARTESAPATTAAAGTPQFTLPLSTATTTPAASTATPATTPSVQLPAVASAPDAVKAPAERPKAPPQMIKLIESFRVTGIRSSGGDSKVLMNDRVYRIGDTVDIDLGLKLTGVAQGALTFENAQGAVYTRNF